MHFESNPVLERGFRRMPHIMQGDTSGCGPCSFHVHPVPSGSDKEHGTQNTELSL